MEEIKLNAKDGYQLVLHVFKNEHPKAVVQCMHGMCEHQDRYTEFADFLCANGYTVVTADMRGHGKDAEVKGYFGKKGHLNLVQDQNDIYDYITKTFPNIPVYAFAHSMGTITMRNVLLNNSGHYQKAVLSGYPNYVSATGFGVLLANVKSLFQGSKHPSPMLSDIVFNDYKKSVKNRQTDFDWISHNQNNINTYMDDPLCGFDFTISGYNALFKLLINIKSSKKFNNVNKDLKILLIGGEDDPVLGGENGKNHSIKVLKGAGFDIENVIDYKNMRHELLQELEKKTVMEDVLNFFNN